VTEIRVRFAVPGDAEAIARAHIQAWQIGYRTMLPNDFLGGLDEAAGANRWASRLRDAEVGAGEVGVEFLVAEHRRGSGRDVIDLAGIATIGPTRPDPEDASSSGSGEVWMINVRPDAWSKGLGTALLAAAVDRLLELGYTDLSLWVLRHNERARRFYEVNGWEADGAAKTEEIGGAPMEEVRYRYRGAVPPQA